MQTFFRCRLLVCLLFGLAAGCRCWGIPEGEAPTGKIVQIADSTSPKSVTAAREYFIVAFCPVVLQLPFPAVMTVAEDSVWFKETALLVDSLARMTGGTFRPEAEKGDCWVFRSRVENGTVWVLELFNSAGTVQYSAKQQIKQ